jgi:hypothetical protein
VLGPGPVLVVEVDSVDALYYFVEMAAAVGCPFVEAGWMERTFYFVLQLSVLQMFHLFAWSAVYLAERDLLVLYQVAYAEAVRCYFEPVS